MEDLELGALPHSKISFTDGTVSNPEPHRPQRTVSQNPKSKWRSSSFYRDNLWFPDWPGVKELIRKEWPDFLLLTIITILPLMLFLFAMPLVPKYFTLNDGHLAYPKRKEYINTFMSILIGIAVPIVIIVPISIFLIGSFWDMHGAIMGLLFSLTTADCFQMMLKFFIGGLRPNFLEICQPQPWFYGEGFRDEYYLSRSTSTRSTICTGKRHDLANANMSFPSGHSTAAFAGFLYLSLWFNAKFKIFANYRGRLAHLLLFSFPLLLASLLALSKIVDYWHHWYDVLAGSVIGTLFAILAYRVKYVSVWDWRYNHIPARYIGEKEWLDKLEPRKDLTAINLAGWENKHTRQKEKDGKHGTDDTEEGNDHGSAPEDETSQKEQKRGNVDEVGKAARTDGTVEDRVEVPRRPGINWMRRVERFLMTPFLI